MEPTYGELKTRIAQLEADLARPDPSRHESAVSRPIVSREQARAANRVAAQIAGLLLIILGIWAWGQPGNSLLILGILVGPFLLLSPDIFSR